jgi:hypothetical protein
MGLGFPLVVDTHSHNTEAVVPLLILLRLMSGVTYTPIVKPRTFCVHMRALIICRPKISLFDEEDD